MSRAIRSLYGFLAILVVLACMPVSVPPTTVVVPAFDPNSINTAIALTAEAAATQTAQMIPPTLTPTVTLIPAKIDTPTESATATFLFLLPTYTLTPTLIQPGSSGAQFECQVISQNPISNTKISKGSTFDTTWNLINVGTDRWDPNNTDYRYSSGTKLHLSPAYDLDRSVSPGEAVDLVVNMKAPNAPGTYSTIWKMKIGKELFCSMKLTIIVE